MKILHIEAGRHLYGGALQVKYLLEGLDGSEVENLLVCPEGAAIGGVCREFATVKTLPWKGELDLRLPFQIKALAKQFGADLIHVHSRRAADVWGPLAAHWARIPALLTRRVDNPEPSWLARQKYQRWFQHSVAISEGIRQVLLNEGVRSDAVSTIRSAVDTECYQPVKNGDWFYKAFHLSKDHFVMGVVAQLIERKGHRVLFKALPELIGQYPHIRILIFGKGRIEPELRAEVIGAGLGEHVRFCGFREDIQSVLPNLDLLVHPAFIEGLGVALLQAAACGVPVVSCRTGGIPEAVLHGEHGLLVAPGDAQALADAIKTLITDETLRKAFSLRGRQRMTQEFSIPVMCQSYLALYQQLLKK